MSRRPAILRQRRWIGLLILVGLAFGQAVTIIVTAFATRDVFMFLREGGSAVPVTALVAIALAGSALFALRALEGSVAERTGQSYAADIREALFKHITRMPASAIARRRSGALALRYVGDLTAFKGWVSRGLARLISASITIPSAFVVLYLLEPWLVCGSRGAHRRSDDRYLLVGTPTWGGPFRPADAARATGRRDGRTFATGDRLAPVRPDNHRTQAAAPQIG